MTRLLQQYVNIALFRATPQDLPGQTVALWISVAAAFVTGVAGLLFAYDFAEAIGRSVLSLLLPAAIVFLILKVRRVPQRFNQTFSAMCGSAAVIYVLAFPFMPWFFNADADTQAGKWIIMLVLVIDIWALLITAHIFKHALDVGFATAISFSIALMFVTIFVIESVSPQRSPIDSTDTNISSIESAASVTVTSADITSLNVGQRVTNACSQVGCALPLSG